MVSEMQRKKRRDGLIVMIAGKYGEKAFNARDVAALMSRVEVRGLGRMLEAMIRDGKIIKCGRTLYKIKKNSSG